MLFYERKLHIGVSAHLLRPDKFLKLIVIQGLYGLLVELEVFYRQGECGVNLFAAPDLVRQVFPVVADEIFLEGPGVFLRIIYRGLCSKL